MQFLILMKGHPGSGKSSLARALARHSRAAYVDKDRFRDLLEEGGAQEHLATGLSYEGMWRLCDDQLASGLHVVADSPLSYPATYQRGLALAARHGAVMVVVQVICSDQALWRSRLDARQRQGMLQHHTSSWQKLQTYLESLADRADYPITSPLLVCDTVHPVEELAEHAWGWLAGNGKVTG